MFKPRLLLLPVLFMLHLNTTAQAPFWEWANPVTGPSDVRGNKVQAIDGGCFATINGGSVYLPDDTLTGSGSMVFANSSGELRMGVEMSEPRQMRDIGNGRIDFVSEIEGSFLVGGETYTSEAGFGLITGSLDTSGTFTDVLAMPDIMMGFGYHFILDVHKGPSSDLFVLGAFTDSIAIADTMLFGTGTFLARFNSTMELMRADRYEVHPYYGHGAVVEGVEGVVYIALIQSREQSSGILGEGLVMGAIDTNGVIQSLYANSNASFYPDLYPCLSANASGGLYLAYSRYAGFDDGSPITVLRFSNTGEVLWENSMAFPVNAFGGAAPYLIETTATGGVLISGYSTAPLALPGLDYMVGGPKCVVYELSADNEFRWAISNDQGNVFGGQASLNNAGEVYVAGWQELPARFGTHMMPADFPATTAYIAKIGYGFLGINDNSASPLSMFPNPTNDHFRVTLPEPSANWVQVIDQQGRVIHEERTTGQQVDIDVTGIRPGSYVVRSGTSVGQLIVQ